MSLPIVRGADVDVVAVGQPYPERRSGETRSGPGYRAAVGSRATQVRQRFQSHLDSRQQRGVRILGWVSIICLAGLTGTGLWQLLAHESNPSWFGHVPGMGVRQQTQPSDGVADLHGIFGAAAAVIALVGGGWFAFRVLFDVPRLAVIGLVVSVVGLVTGSVIRFNAVKLSGRTYEEAGSGYAQLFLNDVEFVVTDRWDLGALAIRSWTVAHVLTVPVLLLAAWFEITRSAPD